LDWGSALLSVRLLERESERGCVGSDALLCDLACVLCLPLLVYLRFEEVVVIKGLRIETDWADAFHMLLGFITRLFAPWTIILFVIYVVYQVGERESEARTIRDLMMYVLGFLLGELFFTALFFEPGLRLSWLRL